MDEKTKTNKIERLVGDKMTNQKATLSTYKVDCTGCKVCASDYQADNLRHAIARLPGVSNVKVDEVTGKVVVQFDSAKINLTKITKRVEKLGYHFEVASTEESK
jgi:copper chaperone CopZ